MKDKVIKVIDEIGVAIANLKHDLLKPESPKEFKDYYGRGKACDMSLLENGQQLRIGMDVGTKCDYKNVFINLDDLIEWLNFNI